MSTQWFLRLLAVAVLVVGLAAESSAQGRGRGRGRGNGGGNGGGRHSAPELNPATGVTALALLTGGILVIRGRRRK